MGSCTQRPVSGTHRVRCAGFSGNPSVYSTATYSTEY
jgi:hypothetical protein